MIRAILRAQFLSLRGFAFLRNPVAWASSLPSLLFYLLFAMFAVGAFVLFYTLDPADLARWLPFALFLTALYWQIAPVITATTGASLDLQKLLVYPIAAEKLFLVEVLLRVLNVMEMLILIFGAALGLIFNPALFGILAPVRILLAFAAFILWNLLLAASLRVSVERLFRRKRVKEVGVLLFVLLCALPRLLASSHIDWSRVLPFLPVQSFLPWSAAASLALGRSPIFALLTLAAWLTAVWFFGRWQFLRSLHSDPGASAAALRQRRPQSLAHWSDAIFRLPARLWSDPVAALVECDLRTLARSAGARQAFFMGFTFGILILLPRATGGRQGGFFSLHFFTWVSFYSLFLIGGYTLWNVFGYDRSAVQFFFLAPVSFRRVLLAKNLAAAFVQAAELLILTAVFMALPLHLHWAGVIEAYVVTGVALLYMCGLGNYVSVRSPSPLDPEKSNRGGGSRGTASLMMLGLPLLLFPIVLAYWGGYVFHSPTVFYALLFAAAIVGAICYWVATDSAVHRAQASLETIAASLSRGSGPISIT